MPPSVGSEEKEVVACIKAEMEKLGFDEVEVDGLGNIIGWKGQSMMAETTPMPTAPDSPEHTAGSPLTGAASIRMPLAETQLEGFQMDKEKILSAAEGCRKDLSAFLRAMISHPSESCEARWRT